MIRKILILVMMLFFAVLFIDSVQGQPSPDPIVLQWSPSPSVDILAGYNMYRSEVTGEGYVKLNDELIPATGAAKETYTDTNIEWGTTYYYVCRAVSIWDEESINSNEAWKKRTPPAPLPPLDLDAVGGD